MYDRCMPEQVLMMLARTEQMKAEGSAMFGFRLPLTGEDVLAIKGLKPGPQVKECMEYLIRILPAVTSGSRSFGYAFEESDWDGI